jgi:ethanolaminephosphotransferase
LTFYTQTWEEYHTKTLTLGVVSGPVEGVLTLCVVYACTAYVGGGSYWYQSMLETIGVPKLALIPQAVYNLAWTDWWLGYGGIMLVFNTISR